MAAGSVTGFLIANGWQRSDEPADDLGYCGAITEAGECWKAPRWFRPFDGALCATHARQATEHRNEIRAAGDAWVART